MDHEPGGGDQHGLNHTDRDHRSGGEPAAGRGVKRNWISFVLLDGEDQVRLESPDSQRFASLEKLEALRIAEWAAGQGVANDGFKLARAKRSHRPRRLGLLLVPMINFVGQSAQGPLKRARLVAEEGSEAAGATPVGFAQEGLRAQALYS